MPFVAGFLFLLTLCKQPVSDCTEIICAVEGCHVVKRWGAILLTLGLSSGIGFTAQAGGWERLSNTSPWKGSFVRSDGRTITITDADPDLLFISMVSSQELGMACFAPGIDRSFYVNENTENEKWEFSVYTSMSWEEWTLHGPSDKREVGRVDYTYMDLYDNPIYTKEDMILYNTMSGETCYLFSLGTNREDQFVREKNKPHSPVFQDHAAYKRLYRNTNFYYLPICFANFFQNPWIYAGLRDVRIFVYQTFGW